MAFRIGINLKVVNVLDATQPVETASVPLVPNGELSGILGAKSVCNRAHRFVNFLLCGFPEELKFTLIATLGECYGDFNCAQKDTLCPLTITLPSLSK